MRGMRYSIRPHAGTKSGTDLWEPDTGQPKFSGMTSSITSLDVSTSIVGDCRCMVVRRRRRWTGGGGAEVDHLTRPPWVCGNRAASKRLTGFCTQEGRKKMQTGVRQGKHVLSLTSLITSDTPSA